MHNTISASTSSDPKLCGPLLTVSIALAITAAVATYLLIQFLQNGSLVSFPGVGIAPYNLTIYCVGGLYGLTAILTVAHTMMLKNLFHYYHEEKGSCFEGLRFLKRFITHPTKVGAIAPSSHALAVQITDPIPDRSQMSSEEPGKRFLEIGAGTGVFTREILKKLGPNDILDVVEYDHDFCEKLKHEFKGNSQISIHEKSIIDYQSDPYDVIVSGLPLNAFEPEFVEKILKKYEDLSKTGGTMSYFEYIALEKIKRAFLFGTSYLKFSQVLDLKNKFILKHHAKHTKVWGNFPPARVQRCVIQKA